MQSTKSLHLPFLLTPDTDLSSLSKAHSFIFIENIFGISAEVFKAVMTSSDSMFSELRVKTQPARSSSENLAKLQAKEEHARKQLVSSHVK